MQPSIVNSPLASISYRVTAAVRPRYSLQLSEFHRLKSVSREIFDSEYRPSFPKGPWFKGKDGLCWTCHDVLDGFLVLHGSKIDQHDSVREFQLVDTVNFSSILRHCSKRENVVEIKPQSCVDIVNKGFDVLLGTLVEGNNG
jgi:hypothetical protein